MEKLKDKIAVVTGGSSGIGLAAAQKLVEEGAYVFITGRRQTELDKAKAILGKNVTAVQGDVSNLDDLDRLYQIVKEEKGAVDVIVANAAFLQLVTLKDATPEHFDNTFNVNARGTFFTVQKALPLLRDGGSIVLVASTTHKIGIPVYTAYAASKAAMRSFARTWAAELKDRNIRVNAVSPGPTDTGIMDRQFETKAEADAMKETQAKRVPMGRLGRPEEVADAILFFASNDSSFITGVDLVVGGGLTDL